MIGGLSADSVVKHPQALEIFPEVNLIDFDRAAKDALAKTHPSYIERVWDDGRPAPKSIKHEGCFIDHREVAVRAGPEKVLEAINCCGSEELVPVSNRKLLDSTAVLFHWKAENFGDQWIEWRTPSPAKSVTNLSQTVFFSPRGLPGFLYWYLFYPFHVRRFRNLIDTIARRSETR